MNMTDASLGWIIGILVGIVLVVILLKAINKNGKAKTDYDERQQIERGKAYKYGFYTMMIACVLLLTLQIFEVDLSTLGLTTWFLPNFAGIIAQISYSIFHDAYEGLNTSMPRFVGIMTGIAVFNFAFALISFGRIGLTEGGLLRPQFLNLLCGILFLIIAVELLVKKMMNNRGERDEA